MTLLRARRREVADDSPPHAGPQGSAFVVPGPA